MITGQSLKRLSGFLYACILKKAEYGWKTGLFESRYLFPLCYFTISSPKRALQGYNLLWLIH